MCLSDYDLSSVLYNMSVRKSQNEHYNIQNLTMENGNCGTSNQGTLQQ